MCTFERRVNTCCWATISGSLTSGEFAVRTAAGFEDPNKRLTCNRPQNLPETVIVILRGCSHLRYIHAHRAFETLVSSKKFLIT